MCGILCYRKFPMLFTVKSDPWADVFGICFKLAYFVTLCDCPPKGLFCLAVNDFFPQKCYR